MLESDDRLLSAARAGDQYSFEELIRPHIAPGYRLAAAMLGDRDQAEDAVQEAVLRAWRAVGRLRPGSRVRPWFLTIVANESRSMRRSRWWSVLRVGEAQRSESGRADEATEHSDLVDALRRLSPDERAAVFLRFFEDLNSREVGAVLGISAVAARSRIHRALKRLRVDLGEETP